jgi:CRP/FNR family cyclic AMP-dependent transcriptional regulator
MVAEMAGWCLCCSARCAAASPTGPWRRRCVVAPLRDRATGVTYYPVASSKMRSFDVEAFLTSPALAGTIVRYHALDTIFSQGDPCETVLYVLSGSVKLVVLSRGGKEAVIGVIEAGDFFGEGALAGQQRRLATAIAMVGSRIRAVPKQQMVSLLHEQRGMADRFIAHMLARTNRLEEDLIDQLFNASEKRLARTLLLLARYGKPSGTRRVLPRISQEVLAEMVGTTRSRVNFFMNKFRKLGFIDYNGDLQVHDALLSVVLQGVPPEPSAEEASAPDGRRKRPRAGARSRTGAGRTRRRASRSRE